MHSCCIYCLKDGGHTEHCAALRKRASNSNITHSIQYACARATLSAYKQDYGNDKNLINMWTKSVDFWSDMVASIVTRAVRENRIAEIFLPDA